MTENCLYGRSEFAECAVIFGNQKMRIVSEAVFDPGFQNNLPPTPIFRRHENFSLRIAERNVTDIVGSPFAIADRFEQRNQFAVVGGIIARFAGEPCRENAGLSVEGIDAQTAVFRQHGGTDREGGFAGFLRRILGKRTPILDDFGSVGKFRK